MGYLQIILLLVLSISVVRSQDDGEVQDVLTSDQDMTSSDTQGEELAMPGTNESNPNADEVEAPPALAKTPRVETVSANSFQTRCQECRVTRADNGQEHYYDTNTFKNLDGRCIEYECGSGEDWCLVTYYENRATPQDPYDEVREYSCGTKAMRDSDSICRNLAMDRNDNKDRMAVQECQTKRSSSTSTSYSSLLIALTALLASKLLLN